MAPLRTTPLGRRLCRMIVLLPYAAVSLAVLLFGQTTSLEVGKTVEGRLSDGESRDYSFGLKAGQYARVLVDQRSINLAAKLFAPDGTEIFAADSESIGENEIAEVIAGVPGTYQLQIAPSEQHAPAGEYAVTLEGGEPATERHWARVAGAREFARGMALYLEGSRTGILKAIDHVAKSLPHWRDAQDRAAESRALATIAVLHAEAGNRDNALAFAGKALGAARDSRDPVAEARALDALGQVNYYFGDKHEATDYYERAIPLMRAAGKRASAGSAMSNLAVAYRRTGEKGKALELLQQAMQIFRELQDRRMMADVAGNMGLTYDDLGEYQKALESHQNDLALKRELGERASQAIAWNNIGTAYSGLGEYQKALDAYNAALDINRSMDNQWNVAINLNNIAWIHGQLADYQRALALYQESLGIVRKINDRQLIAAALNNMAEIHAEQGDYRRAAEMHLEALPLRRATGDADGEANSLNNLGKAYDKLGDRARAREYLQQALAMHRNNGNRYLMARTLRNLGELDSETGDSERARQFLDEALATNRAIHDRSGEAAALADLACLERGLGRFSEAHQRADEAAAVLESLRLAVASPKLRASFFAAARDLQELDIAVLMRMSADHPGNGFDAAALLASERGRARSLLEMLGEGAGHIRRGVDEALLARERDLEQLISAKSELQLRLSGKHTEPEAQAIGDKLDALTAELDQVQSRIRETSPRYAALTHPSPLNLQDIQAKVLDTDDTVLLEYALGKDGSFLWAVTGSTMRAFNLPPRAEIESTVRRVYELLTARNQKFPGETPSARAARVRRADLEYSAAALKASGILLGPVVPLIRGKRLLIVGEGVLQYLPFAALPDPETEAVPVALSHEIITAPSASVMAALREQAARRKPASKALAVIADPVFSAGDPRILRSKESFAVSAASSVNEGRREFTRLRFSRAEAEEITMLAPPESTLKALDFDATRDAVLKPELGQYRILHFATHSLIDNQRPELSGVVLSLFDRFGRPQNGFLRLYEIYNLRLGADLVVLSACQTALGRETKGEGLIGLARGFLYAGAPRVVATLWEIDDRATAELMKRFYERMLAGGERPAAALRGAQVAMWRAKGWAAPYYWGAFTIYGEWR